MERGAQFAIPLFGGDMGNHPLGVMRENIQDGVPDHRHGRCHDIRHESSSMTFSIVSTTFGGCALFVLSHLRAGVSFDFDKCSDLGATRSCQHHIHRHDLGLH